METSASSNFTYDMPQDQLDYFHSSSKKTPSLSKPYISVLSDIAALRCPHKDKYRTLSKTPSVFLPDSLSDKRPSELSCNYANRHSRSRSDLPSNQSQSLLSEKAHEPQNQSHHAIPRANRPQPAHEGYVVGSVPMLHDPAATLSATPSEKKINEHTSPSVTSSVVRGRNMAILPSTSSTPRRLYDQYIKQTQPTSILRGNSYDQPQSEPQAPLKKSSFSYRASAPPEVQVQQSKIYLLQKGSSLLSEPGSQSRSEYDQRTPQQEDITHTFYQSHNTTIDDRYVRVEPTQLLRRTDSVEQSPQVTEEEANCTFHPRINPSSQRSATRNYDSPSRECTEASSRSQNRQDNGQEVYSKLYATAEVAKRSLDELKVKRSLEDDAAVDPYLGVSNSKKRQSAKHDAEAEPDAVFTRLYTDAQRYNRDKAKLEEQIKLKQQREHGDFSDEIDSTGADLKERDDGVKDPDTETIPKNYVSPKKHIVNPEIFERLSRPTHMTVKFQKQKELDEEEKRRKEAEATEKKNTEMEKIAHYNWEIPARSFSFANLKSQNSLFVA